TAANSTARTSPVIREASVRPETVDAAWNRLTGASVAAGPPQPGGYMARGYNRGLCWQHPQTPKGLLMASAKPKKKNPRLASGRKRARQDVKLNAANTSLRSKYRTAVKNVEMAVAAGDKAKATE